MLTITCQMPTSSFTFQPFCSKADASDAVLAVQLTRLEQLWQQQKSLTVLVAPDSEQAIITMKTPAESLHVYRKSDNVKLKVIYHASIDMTQDMQ